MVRSATSATWRITLLMCTAATSKAQNQESQRKTETPVKSMSKKLQRAIHQVKESESSSHGEIYSINSITVSGHSKHITEPQLRNGEASNWTVVPMQIDGGLEANCLRLTDFTKIENRPWLKKTRAVLKAYSGERVWFPKVVFLGQFYKGFTLVFYKSSYCLPCWKQ